MKKLAFTLAEVLITLGIIGVVAGMTIPTLSYNYKEKQNSVKLQHTYSTLKNAMATAIAENVNSGVKTVNNMTQMKKWYNTFITPYLNVLQTCYGAETGCWAEDTFYARGTKITKNPTGACGGNTISFVLSDGSFVCIDDYQGDLLDSTFGVENAVNELSIIFRIDINGNNKPNQYGKDIFIAIFNGNKIVPAGNNRSISEVNSNCSKNGDGYWCMQKAIDSGYKFPLYK
ncbi:type II secretion system protein [bacterium]|nr:type II secretion system protein [bacterium]